MAESVEEAAGTADEGGSYSLLVKNLPADASEEVLAMYLENTLDIEEFTGEIEFNTARNAAVFSIETAHIAPDEAIQRIQENPFLKSTLEASFAPELNRLLVTGLKDGLDKDTLEMYFEQTKLTSVDDTVLTVEFDPSKHAAVVTYEDVTALDNVLACEKHDERILGPDVTVEACGYFTSLEELASNSEVDEHDQVQDAETTPEVSEDASQSAGRRAMGDRRGRPGRRPRGGRYQEPVEQAASYEDCFGGHQGAMRGRRGYPPRPTQRNRGDGRYPRRGPRGFVGLGHESTEMGQEGMSFEPMQNQRGHRGWPGQPYGGRGCRGSFDVPADYGAQQGYGYGTVEDGRGGGDWEGRPPRSNQRRTRRGRPSRGNGAESLYHRSPSFHTSMESLTDIGDSSAKKKKVPTATLR